MERRRYAGRVGMSFRIPQKLPQGRKSRARTPIEEQIAPAAHRVYEFGPFRIDLPNRLLHRDGQPVRLSGKVFDLLVFFVENSGRLLTKDEILHAVWPDVVVEEGN